ncbi:hypothetical protein J3R04_003071 [Spirilliplanes yamanashiensis]|nr:hypothetical protein [Spirilliplanes yamanashiensis]
MTTPRPHRNPVAAAAPARRQQSRRRVAPAPPVP